PPGAATGPPRSRGAHGRPWSETRPSRRSGEEQQLELADLQLVAVGDGALLDPLPVQVGAVQRTDVAHDVAGGHALQLGMAARHRDVVEEDVAVRVAS